MDEKGTSHNRVVKNTLYLYFRTAIVMLVSLYTSRVILSTLGIEDYGIYNLVAGITAMLSFLNGTLSDATQRFITVGIGKGDNKTVSKIFSLCLILHFVLAILIVLIIEPIGLWLIINKLNIPETRIDASIWIFQFMVVQMIIMFVSVPYNALIIAYERMSAFAMISIVEVVLKLVFVYLLILVQESDRLVFFGFLMLVMQLLLRSMYTIYCRRNFSQIKYSFNSDKNLLKEISGFASWTIIGNLSYVCYTQGLNLLLGVFFSPVVNAARGIAVQIQHTVNTFVKNFQTAINPQIIKSYATTNYEKTISLVFRSSRFSFFLIMIPIIPLLFETEYVLKLWLVDVPANTLEFVQWTLLVAWVNCLGNPLSIANKATGNIRTFELCAASTKLSILPIAYLCLFWGYSPTSVFIVQFCVEVFAKFVNVWITHKQIHYSIKSYLMQVILPIARVALVALLLPLLISIFMEDGLYRLIVLSILSVIWSIIIVLFLGMNKQEREYVFILVKKKIDINHKIN